MTFYLSSPGQQMQADYCRDMPVLISFALWKNWMLSYVHSYMRILIDSGAYSEFTGNAKVNGSEYADWCEQWRNTVHVDAIAGLDDIGGDWRRSMKNYELYGGFPTFHESDPPELLAELICLAKERSNWIGIGLIPPRSGKWSFVKRTLSKIPDGIHVHFWAGGEYCGHPRINSCDSTNWFRDAWSYKNMLPFLTPAESIELVVKRYSRMSKLPSVPSNEPCLFQLITENSDAQQREISNAR